MSVISMFAMANHTGLALLVAAIVLGLTVRVALLLSQKDHTFRHR